MSDRALTLALESRLVNAWPAFQVSLVDGWLLRFADGYSKRANSASPIAPGATLDPGTIAHIASAYEARALQPCFRLTGIEDGKCDAMLNEAGLVPHDPSLCLVARVERVSAPDAALCIERTPSPAWIAAAAAAYGGDKGNAETLGRIVHLIREPAAFATFRGNGGDFAWGLAVAERGYVGLYDIVVDPSARGRGYGRALVTGLMSWGLERRATQAYLQVRETNEPARALYRSLGFSTAYRYTQRVRPQSSSGA